MCFMLQNYIIGAFKPPCHITISFIDGKTRKKASIKKENGQTAIVPLFQSLENIVGEVSIDPVQGKKLEHTGVKIELLGQIVRELDVPGEIYERKTFPFEFSSVEMPYESYNGVNVRLRYVLKVTISRNYVSNIVEYQDFWVKALDHDFGHCLNYQMHDVEHVLNFLDSVNSPSKLTGEVAWFATITQHQQLTIVSRVVFYGTILLVVFSKLPWIVVQMEVGIEDCLHIEFEYNKSKYHLKDVIIGKIYFLLVRIKLKNMELEIRRRESTGSGPNTYVETETLAKFELMDGAPVRGESIPIRLFLSPYELTPTYRNINNKFSVKYFLNLVLVDEEDRRYFKQQEITVYRLQEAP
ncbi:hypothetical protein ZIOFF_046355 [Zingiber officinale]|uniref:Uncharacterized protein n=1 Tax=Zingiber officinale TaxID=94328 RepID=A0A8J5G4Y5_ZINOF|nr:hypothetical protein ZIOFF_046355 [Zingiber officinale]